MNLLKALNLIKKSGLVSLSLFLTSYVDGQMIFDSSAYIVKPGLTQITKAEFLNTDTVSLNCKNCKLMNFTITASGYSSTEIEYQDVSGNFIPEKIKDVVKSVDSCTIWIMVGKIGDNPWALVTNSWKRKPLILKVK